MRERFDQQLATLDDHIQEMADLSLSMLHDGLQALMDLDRDACEAVCQNVEPLAERDEAIEKEILRILATQNPVAEDLRRLGLSLKLITYINRVGRYGYDIAKLVRVWPENQGHVKHFVTIETMGNHVKTMLSTVLESHMQGQSPSIDEISRLERDVDELRRSVWRETLTYMLESPSNIERCAHYMMIARYLERAADNITKMAEKVHYVWTGKRVIID